LSQANLIRLQEDVDNKKIYCITGKGVAALKVEIEKREQYAAIGKEALDLYKEPAEWENTNTGLDTALHMA